MDLSTLEISKDNFVEKEKTTPAQSDSTVDLPWETIMALAERLCKNGKYLWGLISIDTLGFFDVIMRKNRRIDYGRRAYDCRNRSVWTT